MTPPSSTRHLLARFHDAPVQGSLALIFPGQGSQKAGMGADLCEASPAARGVFQEAEAVLDLPLSRLCFEGPEETLRQTAVAQPAIMVTSLATLAAALEAAAITHRPAFVAGHSLGEYTALVVAGALDFADALRLVKLRGQLMQEAAERQPGTMVAIVGLGESGVEEICRLSGAKPCNYNSPSQIVVGGSPPVVARASALAGERGGRALPLRVSGAFHTSLMAAASREFVKALDNTPIADPRIPVVANASALAMTTAQEIREELASQMTSPVLWHQSMTAMVQGGVTAFVEVGPGRVLTSLVSRTFPDATAVSLDGAAALPSLSNV